MRIVPLGLEQENQQCHLVIEFTCFLCLERVSAISIVPYPQNCFERSLDVTVIYRYSIIVFTHVLSCNLVTLLGLIGTKRA